MNKLTRSWLLLKSSLSVLRRNKQLLIFPIVVCACTIVILGFFLAPPLLRSTGYSYFSPEHWKAISNSLFVHSNGAHGKETVVLTRGALVYLAFMYLIAMFVGTFFNVALYHEILAALRGDAVSVGRGLKFACTRLGTILMWTLFAGLVGLIIKAIEERLDFVGRIVGRLIGVAWSVASVFAIPVIVHEERTGNPITVLKQSATLLKRTWGEALIGYAGLTLANTIIVLGSIVLLVGAMFVSIALNNYWLIAGTGAIWLLAIFAWGYLVSAASQVYRGALYLYAAEGTIPEPYDQEMLNMAWKFKKARSG